MYFSMYSSMSFDGNTTVTYTGNIGSIVEELLIVMRIAVSHLLETLK